VRPVRVEVIVSRIGWVNALNVSIAIYPSNGYGEYCPAFKGSGENDDNLIKMCFKYSTRSIPENPYTPVGAYAKQLYGMDLYETAIRIFEFLW